MLDVNYLRENKATAIAGLKIRNIENPEQMLDDVIATDDSRKKIQHELDQLLAQSNKLSKEIGMLFKSGKAAEANEAKAKTGELKEQIKVLQEKQNEVITDLTNQLYQVPNIPHPHVPAGKSDKDNEVVREWGVKPNLSKDALPHWELAKKFDLFDLELGVKITGAGFPVYKGQGARLQRGLINFFLEKAIENGYEEVIPPLMVNAASATATGQLPDKEGQMYEMTLDPFYMIPTAEVPITNIYRDTQVKKEELPIKMVGYTPCFRREAGSYGKDVRGLNRLHQFDKVEIVQFVHPDRSHKVLEEMVVHVENLVRALGLPYRVLRLCGGDLTFTSVLTYDIEVYSAAQDMWLEVSSISNFETYQSNRLKCRFKNDEGKNQMLHTLNGSAIALPRIIAAFLENNQDGDCIHIPKELQEYVRMEKIAK
ncbi:MAG: serine--tRNA ligase [Chitinophagales bacterium]